MSHEVWLLTGVVLLVIGAYMAIKNREWFWFVVASAVLMYAVPQLVTVVTA